MFSVIDWLIPLVIGATFLTLGSLKLYGFFRGITGGRDKPMMDQLCGT